MGGWGGAWDDVIHAALHIQLVFAHGAPVLINPLYSEPYKTYSWVSI